MKKRILVFEKNTDILEMIGIILTDEGYTVDLISSKSSIFDHINRFKPDAILVDVIRPTEDGEKICAEISAAQETAHIPVIVISTHPKAEIMRKMCADEVIPKPFDISFLTAVLEEQLMTA